MLTSGDFFRKIIHIGNAVIPIGYLVLFNDRWIPAGILFVLFLIALAVETLRNRPGFMDGFFKRYLNIMLKPEEINGSWTGATWVFAGAFLTILIFPKTIAILALLYMGFGDTLAALVGKSIGHPILGAKSIEGFFAGLAICLILAWFFPAIPWAVRIVGAVIAMIVELFPIPIDDNLRIPVFSALAMVFMLAVLP